jgi:V8-like Glu-specific endopeptidase
MGVVLLSSCGFRSEATAPHKETALNPSGDATLTTGSQDKSENGDFSGWQLNCLSQAPGDCPNQVGQFVALVGSKSYQCTASLIAPDVVLTNSHCLNNDEKLSPDEICKRAAIVFANQSAAGREVAECEKVLVKSKIDSADKTNLNPDYAILKLKTPLRRGFFKISREGIADQAQLHVAKVNPTEDSQGGVLEVSSCTALHGTFLSPNSTHDDDATEVVKGCRIIPGNSGSPLLNAQGLLVGVIFSIPERMSQNDEFAQKAVSLKAALATNASCIDDISVDRSEPLSAHCTERAEKATSISLAPLIEQATQFAHATGFKEDIHFVYGIENDQKNSAVLVYSPQCFSNPEAWIKEFLADSADHLQSQATVMADVIRWKMVEVLDDNLKASWILERLPSEKKPIKFSPATLQNTWSSPVNSSTRPLWQICS